MARDFLDEDFLLETDTAKDLYAAARKEPIYDYHCHLSPAHIAQNRQMSDLADAWLSGDHYKWRMMRAMGIDEEFITGRASGYDKVLAWSRTVERLIGNPLYHWTHLELQRYFGIEKILTGENAPWIWKKANALLQKPELSVKGIFKKFNIYAVGTTDDPVDSLEHHRAIAEGTAPIGKIKTKVFPSFRPDRALELNAENFSSYIDILAQASGTEIKTHENLLCALEKRLDFFIEHGCRSCDHGLEYAPFAIQGDKEIEKTFKNALSGLQVSKEEADAYKTKMLVTLANLYAKRGIVMQLHFCAVRNVSRKSFSLLGANTGYDACGDFGLSENLSRLLDCMESSAEGAGLPKTILYSLNPKDYYPLSTIMGGFTGTGVEGKMQLGCAWWFCDHRDGMEEQMRVLANVGILCAFVGMLTDSRSFLSYPRHEYFRRVMCNLIGKWVENGEYPDDSKRLEKIVRDISFNNAKRYFEGV